VAADRARDAGHSGAQGSLLSAEPRAAPDADGDARRAPRGARPRVEALVWRRTDFRESSRVVTLLTRDQGKVRAIAKGAHRPDSPLLGKVDYCNLLRVELWRRGTAMPLLARAELLHEPRALREPTRFLLADHLVGLVDEALPDGRADEALFDLVHGGLRLFERCPAPALAAVLCGVEWRFLLALGMQPPLDACAETGAPLPARAPVALSPAARGFVPARAAPRGALRASPASRAVLRTLGATKGSAWPGLALPRAALADALTLLGSMLMQALERPPRSRPAAVRAALRACSAG